MIQPPTITTTAPRLKSLQLSYGLKKKYFPYVSVEHWGKPVLKAAFSSEVSIPGKDPQSKSRAAAVEKKLLGSTCCTPGRRNWRLGLCSSKTKLINDRKRHMCSLKCFGHQLHLCYFFSYSSFMIKNKGNVQNVNAVCSVWHLSIFFSNKKTSWTN